MEEEEDTRKVGVEDKRKREQSATGHFSVIKTQKRDEQVESRVYVCEG